MAQCQIVYWRDIPAQIIVRKGRAAEKRELPERFITAIDRCAMRVGARDSDTYLQAWRRGDTVDCTDDLIAEADAAYARTDHAYDQDRLNALVHAGGFEAKLA